MSLIKNNNFYFFFLFIFFLFGLSSSNFKIKNNDCKKGQFRYSAANYKNELFIKEEYQRFFDSILSKPIYKCFCENEIKSLPTKSKHIKKNLDNHRDSVLVEAAIEPLFINLKNFDGLYGKRMWFRGGRNPRFRCGFWHYLFILSRNTYFPLTDDSIKNVKLVKNKLSNSFSKEELEMIIDWDISKEIICNHYTYNWPVLIKEDSLTIWDIKKEIDRKSNKK